MENKTGLPKEIGTYLNPGAIYGGTKGFNISKNNLLTKFIKGDADLGWSALNKKHWAFDKEARNSTNVAMASLNRIMPFLSNAEKTPARIAAYKVGRRTKGNASVSLKDIKSNEATYTGSSTPEGNNGDRDLLGMYLFKNDPLISRSPWFKKVSKSFKPAKGERFSYSQRYSELYPGIEGRRYQMQSVVREGHPLKFNSIDDFNSYSNGIGKIQGKEGDMVIETPMGFQTFRQPGTNYVGPIDDVGGHLVKIDYNNKGKLTQISQDMWKFNPADYAKRWSGNTKSEAVRANKQAALMDKVGTPFILQQENPIYIGNNRIWESLDRIPDIVKKRRQPSVQSGLLMMKNGNKIVKCQEGSGTWTSEDIGNPVYSKKKPLSIKQQEQIFIKDRQEQGLKNFDKAAKIAYGVARLVPGYVGAATSLIDFGKGIYDIYKNNNTSESNTPDVVTEGTASTIGNIYKSLGDESNLGKKTRYRGANRKKVIKTIGQSDLLFYKTLGNLSVLPDKLIDTYQLYNTVVSEKNGGSLTSDGRRFKFKNSSLVRNSKALSNKRDMRKKFMKSDRPTYSNNRIRKGADGLKFVEYNAVNRPTFNMENTFEEYKFPTELPIYSQPIVTEVSEAPVDKPIETEEPIMKRELFNITPSKGLNEFNKWYDEVEKENPEAKNYRQFLTKMAEQESGFNSRIQNKAGAPAYGYFQFMQDGKRYNNISAYAGTDIETFRNNPKLQIQAAIKLAKSFEKGFSKQDLELAAQKGYTKFGLLGGAWLAGNDGVRRFLQGLGNPSDKHWSKSGAGTSVANRIAMFNF